MKKAILLSVTALFLSGCMMSTNLGVSPKSHFDYPNSNVTPMKRVSGKVSTVSLFVPKFGGGDMKKQAVDNALAQAPGADLLVNYSTNYDYLMIPLFIVPITIYFETVSVEGTAADMEVGYQELK